MYLSEHILKVWANEAQQQKPYSSELFPPSPYYRFFRILATELKPSLSVVLGVCGGGDSLHLALGNPKGTVVGIDIAYDHPEQMEHIKATCPNFIFHQGDSSEAVQSIVQKYGNPQVLFIDTAHTFEQAEAEYNTWKPVMASSHVICFDDLKRTEMRNFWDYVPEPKLRLDELHPSAEGGFGIHWKLQ